MLTACSTAENSKAGKRKNDSVLLISGSESELKLIDFLTKQYQQSHPGIKIELSGGGSAIGIRALIKGEVDVANSSRKITHGELVEAQANGVNPVQIIIAMDAVSIITHSHAGIDSLSLSQLSGLLSGRIKNWKEVGGSNLPVIVFGRNENSGTYHYLLDHLGMDGFATGMHVMQSNAEIVSAVTRQEGAIGYVNLGSVYDAQGRPCKTVWVAGIYVDGGEAYSPYQAEFVANGEYPLSRALYQYVNGPVSENVNSLLRFELSDSTQFHLPERGYFPITPIYKTINSKNGF